MDNKSDLNQQPESNYINVAYTDVWDITKKCPYPEKRHATRIVALIMFLKDLLVNGGLFALTYGLVINMLSGDANWFYAILLALIYKGTELIMYGTLPLTKERLHYDFGQKDYELQQPSAIWRMILMIVSVLFVSVLEFRATHG